MEDSFANHAEGFLRDWRTVIGKTLHKEPQQSGGPGFHDAVLFFEFVDTAFFQNDGNGLKGRTGGTLHAVVQHLLQFVNHLIQLLRRKVQGDDAQHLRQGPAELVILNFQSVENFNHQLVGLIRCEIRQDLEQNLSRIPTNRDGFTVLNQVGQVNRNLKNAGLSHLSMHRFQHIPDVGHLSVPGSAGFQIVQEHGGQLFVGKCFSRQPQDIPAADIREVVHGVAEIVIHHVQGDQVHILGEGAQHILGKEADGLNKGVRAPGRINPKGGNHQNDNSRFRYIVRIVIFLQHIEIEVSACRIAVVQSRFYVEVRTGSNPFPMVVGHLVVRVQYFYQECFKLIDVGGGDVGRRDVLRQLLFVFLPVIRHDAAHERRRLFPNVAGLMGQHFVQEIQGQVFLILGHVGGVLSQKSDVSTGILPALAAAGGFNQAGKLFRVAKAAHHSDVVADSPEFQLLYHLVVPEQGRAEAQWNRLLNALLIEMCGGIFWNIHGNSVLNHQVFEILQFGVDFYVAMALGGIHVVQLVQDDIEGFFEGIEVNDFLILHSGALYAEIRIDEQQGFHGKVFQF